MRILRKRAEELVPQIEAQELWCHDCKRYVQFKMDMSLNGNHVLNCPNCNHEHCRVVENGKITDIRWDSRPGRNQRYTATATGSTIASTFTTYTSASSTAASSTFLYTAWMNVGTAS